MKTFPYSNRSPTLPLFSSQEKRVLGGVEFAKNNTTRKTNPNHTKQKRREYYLPSNTPRYWLYINRDNIREIKELIRDGCYKTITGKEIRTLYMVIQPLLCTNIIYNILNIIYRSPSSLPKRRGGGGGS